MATEPVRYVVLCALLLGAPSGLVAQSAPPAPAKRRAQPKAPTVSPPPPPAPVAPKPPAPAAKPASRPAPEPAGPAPAPQPPPAKPPQQTAATSEEDEAIIDQLELFMLMEMLKDYELLREPEK